MKLNKKVKAKKKNEFGIVVIGSSKGGMTALQTLFAFVPVSFKLPIVVVQHREESSDETFVNILQPSSKLKVKEVSDKDKINSGVIYVAPAGYHLMIEEDHFALSTEEPVSYSRPSIDVLFESAAEEFGAKTIGVILTGLNNDGANGINLIKKAGGLTIVQDPKQAECSEMPEAAIKAVNVDYILTLEKIGKLLEALDAIKAMK